MARVVVVDAQPVAPALVGGPRPTVAEKLDIGAMILPVERGGLLFRGSDTPPVLMPAMQKQPALLTPTITPRPSILAAGQRGKTGAPGEPGPAGGSALQRTAGETVSALRVQYELDGKVYTLDQADAMHIDLLLGVAITSGNVDDPVTIQRAGTLDDSSWAWTLGPVYLGSGGVITQVAPDTGFRVRLGASPSPQRINLEISEPINLGQE